MSLTQGVRRAAQVNRNGVATVFADRTRTWSEFHDRVARLAAGLQSLGLDAGERVALLANNSDRYLEYFFAVPWAGNVFVPVNTRLAPPEVAYWLSDSESRVLFIDDDFLPFLPKLQGNMPSVEKIVYVGDGDAPDGLIHYESLIDSQSAIEDAGREGEDLAGLFYTGGTTGVSKGVMLSHRNLVSNALHMMRDSDFEEDMIWLHSGPMFHLADGTSTFAATMLAASHRFIPKFEPAAALEAIETHRVTNGLFVPVMMNMVVNHPDVTRRDLSSLRGILYGASPMPEAVIRKAMELIPSVGFYHAYGQTETSPLLTILKPQFHSFGEGGKAKSAGRATYGVELCIKDEDGNILKPGEIGEVCAKGPNVMQGYWNKPELTAQTLKDGWIHTGDGGYLDEDGFVYIVDRVKDMIISGGENVYSAEVENAVYQHPAVVECAVIGVPDDKWGERVHAIVRCHEGKSTTEAEIIAFCHDLIANYKCPRSVSFRTEPMPVSGAGKILKTELRKPYWEGVEKGVN
ncbi:long-chain-fatty-acid--CoA ligase [Minwuia sp.]|uniref:long-chain-fatty-acid--CoA ligase n=1 Tax=Minwuia sp. TaxID=2493630 RepID=UPI003A8CADA1